MSTVLHTPGNTSVLVSHGHESVSRCWSLGLIFFEILKSFLHCLSASSVTFKKSTTIVIPYVFLWKFLGFFSVLCIEALYNGVDLLLFNFSSLGFCTICWKILSTLPSNYLIDLKIISTFIFVILWCFSCLHIILFFIAFSILWL